MKKYNRMTLKERENIYKLLQTNHNQTFITKQLGRNKSSISRELARCNSIGYIPDRRQKISESFLRRKQKIFRSKKLLDSVVSFLKEGWSPEQMALRLKLENNGICVVSHETIGFLHNPFL
jgi:IS30 family transposase